MAECNGPLLYPGRPPGMTNNYSLCLPYEWLNDRHRGGRNTILHFGALPHVQRLMAGLNIYLVVYSCVRTRWD